VNPPGRSRRAGRRAASGILVPLLLAALLLAAPGRAALALGSRVSGPGFDGVILEMPSPRPDVEVWTPGYDRIAEMEKRFPPYVKRYIKSHGIVLPRPPSRYKRHYVGILEKGKRLIGASYYGDGSDFVASKKWLETVGSPESFDGDCMGSVYDVDAGEFVLFEIYPSKAEGKGKGGRPAAPRKRAR
jgi:hypothetical protein